MKNIRVIAAAIFSALALCVGAQDYEQAQTSGTTIARVNFLAKGTASVRLLSLDVTSDKAASTVSFITSTNEGRVLLAVSNNPVVFKVYSTNGIILQRNVLLKPLWTNAYYVGVVTNIVSSNQITVDLIAAIGSQLTVGDQVFPLMTNTTPLGAATLRLNGEALWVAPQGSPLLIQVDGTSACSINNIVVKR